MIKKMVFLLIIILLPFSSSLLDAGSRKQGLINHHKFGFYMAGKNLFNAHTILKMKDQINLSGDQVNKIENIVLSFRESSIRKSAEIKIRELRLASYLKSEKVDRKQIEKVIRQISKMKTDCIVEYMNYLLDLREILTDEQFEKLKKINDELERKYKKKKFEEKVTKNQ